MTEKEGGQNNRASRIHKFSITRTIFFLSVGQNNFGNKIPFSESYIVGMAGSKYSLLACHVHFSSCNHRSHISWPKKKAGKITGRPEFINRCERRAKTHHHHYHQKIPSLGRLAWALDTFQDILIMLGIKPHLHILKISVFTLNNLILRLTKNMEKSWQKLGTFFVNEVLKKSKFFKTFH